MRIKDSMEIEGPDGRRLAMVKKALIAPLRDRWAVSVADGPDLDVQGNLLDYEYTIGEGRDKIAEVSKKWFRVARHLRRGDRARSERRADPGRRRGARTRWPTRDTEPARLTAAVPLALTQPRS